MKKINEKINKLNAILSAHKKVAIAFSGGVDSTLLLYIASQVVPTVAISAVGTMQPEHERRFIETFTHVLPEIESECVLIDPLSISEFRQNSPNRCYACKKHIFSKIKEIASSYGCDAIFDGSNLDDLGDYRPGMRALEELGVESPFIEAGLDKSDIYYLSKNYDLPTKNKPSSACLASRIRTGEEITEEKLRAIDEAEAILLEYGINKRRVRIDNGSAWLECEREHFDIFYKNFEQIKRRLNKIGIDIQSQPRVYRQGRMNKIDGAE